MHSIGLRTTERINEAQAKKKEENPIEILRMQYTMGEFEIRKHYTYSVDQTREWSFWRTNNKKVLNCSNQRTLSKDTRTCSKSAQCVHFLINNLSGDHHPFLTSLLISIA